jgi:hypothetical protein
MARYVASVLQLGQDRAHGKRHDQLVAVQCAALFAGPGATNAPAIWADEHSTAQDSMTASPQDAARLGVA